MKKSMKLVLMLTLALLFAGPAHAETVKVMTFNIWVGGGDSLSQTITEVQNANPDIIGLQEATDGASLTAIANAMGFYYDPGSYIASRWPITEIQDKVMPWGYGVAVTICSPTGQEIYMFNCHLTAYPYPPYELPDVNKALDAEDKTQWKDFSVILDNMLPYIATGQPVFLTGDFNCPSHLDHDNVDFRCSNECADEGLIDSYWAINGPPGGHTWPPDWDYDDAGITWTPKPQQEPEDKFDRIDFVYFGGDNVTVSDSTELDSGNWPSDHRAVISTFNIPEGSGGDCGGALPQPTLTLDKSIYTSGEAIEATFSNGPGNSTDWIGIYELGNIPDGSPPSLIWAYTNGTQNPSGGATDGTVVLDNQGPASSLSDGNYTAWFLCCDGYGSLDSVNFEVGDGGDPYCGDGNCDPGEDATNCPADCGGGGDDTVVVTKAEYKADKDEFKVEATSSAGDSVTLTLEGFGEMTWDKDKFKFSAKPLGQLPPCTAVVTSSGGGSDSKYVSGADPCDPGGEPDTDPPTPDPATFALFPAADSSSAISMIATTGTDATGPVEYFFDETSGNPGGSDSGWQTSASYIDTGLTASTQYTYTVQMRDSAATPNVGTASAPASATTDDPPPPDTDPPTPNPATFASAPSADSSSAISMTATTGTDASDPVEYYFDETSGNPGGSDSGWQTSANYTDSGLDADTQYTYTVQMRDSAPTPNVGTVSSPASATTDPAGGGDTVVIIKAEYKADKSELKVEATTSEGSNVTLTVVGYGDMTYDKDLKHKYSAKDVADPGATVTVTSSGGGQDTASVTHK